MASVTWMARTALIAALAGTVPGHGMEPWITSVVSSPALAAPWAIIVHGRLLPQRVVIADWHENQRLMLAAPAPGAPVAPNALYGRPYLDLALFMGPEWAHLERTPAAAATLRVEQANRRARFYLARQDAPAVLVLEPPTLEAFSGPVMARTVEADGVKMLEAHGVPVRVAP